MASNTNINLRNQIIYSIYVRNHTEEGTFNAIVPDLDRIKALGTDIIWLMPIHPIGVKEKKGSLGCPYAIKDYRAVNPAYGTKEDFVNLVDEIHKRGMKCIIDVVYNHTSPDSVLVAEHPEFFFRKENGDFGNMAGDWGDVIDLDYSNQDLWRYQIDTLKLWAEIVDGFRCDVAAKIPVEFWEQARDEVAEVRENCIWLAETVHPGFIKYLRELNLIGNSDSEMYAAFDITYDYDVRDEVEGYLKGEMPLSRLVNMLILQESIYPKNYVKLRCLENHDTPRVASFVKDEASLCNFTAFNYFQKGTPLVHAGQEKADNNCPSLFEYDKVNWNTGIDLSSLMSKLYEIKKNPLMMDGAYNLKAYDDMNALMGSYEKGDNKLVGVFSFRNGNGAVEVPLNDGVYKDLISSKEVVVENSKIDISVSPVIIEA